MTKLGKALRTLFRDDKDTVLITEPDPMLRRLESRALSREFRVIQTSSPEEAVRVAARHETPLDLLLTETRLPRMEGWELTELLKLDYPNLRAVYLSSDSDPHLPSRNRRAVAIMPRKNLFQAGRLRKIVHDALGTPRRPIDDVIEIFRLMRRSWAKIA